MAKAFRVMQVTTVSSDDDFRQVAANERRLKVLDQALEIASKKGCDLVQLPAGFFAASTRDASKMFVEQQVVPRVRAHAVAVLGGVDADTNRKKSAALPYFGFLVRRSGHSRLFERQLSSRNPRSKDTDGVLATKKNAINWRRRVATIASHRIALLICGEQHNPWSRQRLRGRGLTAVFVCGHEGLGQGLVATLQAVARSAECDALHVQHLAAGGHGSFHHVDRQGIDAPVEVGEHPEWREAQWSYTFRQLR